MCDVQVALTKRVMTEVESLHRRIEKLRKTANVIANLEQMLERKFCQDEYSITYPIFEVKREDLPAIRKAVGRLSVERKDVPYDYDTTQTLEVTVKPHDERFNCVSFRYRTPMRSNAKCKVVEQVSKYKTLVCEQ